VVQDLRDTDRQGRRTTGTGQDGRFTDVLATACRASGVMAKPQLLTVCATLTTSAPTTAAGLFMAKYTPGSITEAATMAMMATKDSINMPP
jgi:hypothetical protein